MTNEDTICPDCKFKGTPFASADGVCDHEAHEGSKVELTTKTEFLLAPVNGEFQVFVETLDGPFAVARVADREMFDAVNKFARQIVAHQGRKFEEHDLGHVQAETLVFFWKSAEGHHAFHVLTTL